MPGIDNLRIGGEPQKFVGLHLSNKIRISNVRENSAGRVVFKT